VGEGRGQEAQRLQAAPSLTAPHLQLLVLVAARHRVLPELGAATSWQYYMYFQNWALVTKHRPTHHDNTIQTHHE
jgi:hypothetical protein